MKNPLEGYNEYLRILNNLVKYVKWKRRKIVMDRGFITHTTYGIAYLVMAGVKVEDTFQKWLRESKLLEVSKDYISIYLDLSKGNAMKIVERRHKRDSKSYYIKVI